MPMLISTSNEVSLGGMVCLIGLRAETVLGDTDNCSHEAERSKLNNIERTWKVNQPHS